MFLITAGPDDGTVILVLNKQEIDGAHKDKSKFFPEDFRVSSSSHSLYCLHNIITRFTNDSIPLLRILHFTENLIYRLKQFSNESHKPQIASVAAIIQMELTIITSIQGIIILITTIATNNLRHRRFPASPTIIVTVISSPRAPKVLQ